MSSSNLWSRFTTSRVQEALLDTPVVLIHGPRQCGKTTLAQYAAPEYHYVTFDDQAVLEAARFDPVGFVKRLPEYVILDEVQHVPELFRAIKMSVDQNRKPGRFVLTGSANVLLLPTLSDSLAGRMEIINLLPLARAEIRETPSPTLLELLLTNKLDSLKEEHKTHQSLAERIVEGGFPEPLSRESSSRKRRWHESYLQTLVQRDIQQISNIHKLDKVPMLLTALANQSAQLLNISSLSRDLGIDRATLNQYLALLQQIFLVDILSPWFNNRNKRLVKTPKAHLVDTGISSFLLGVDAKALEADRNLLGHLAENYVYTELKRHATGLDTGVNFYHYRDQNKKEIDLVIETQSGQLIAVETKVAATVGAGDFKVLREFQKTYSDKFTVGVVIYEGEHLLPFGEGMFAVPSGYI